MASIVDLPVHILMQCLTSSSALSAEDFARLDCVSFHFRRPLLQPPNRLWSAPKHAAHERCSTHTILTESSRNKLEGLRQAFEGSWLKLLRFLDGVERAWNLANSQWQLQASRCAIGDKCGSLTIAKQSVGFPFRYVLPPSDIVSVYAGDYCTYTITASGNLWQHGTGSRDPVSTDGGEACEHRLLFGPLKAAAEGCDAASQRATENERRDVSGSQRVVQVAGGRGVTALVTADGQVYTFGQDRNGCCGHEGMEGQYIPEPRLVKALAHQRCKQISVGGAHTLALTDDGTVYAFGSGENGQLGLPGDTSDHGTPQRLDALRRIAGPVVHVAAGGQFSLAVSERGEMYAFGSGQEWGARGRSWTEEQPIEPVASLKELGVHVIRVAASSAVCAALDILGRVYMWGSGYCGSLGNGNEEDESEPRWVQALDGIHIVQVALGKRRTLVLSDEGKVYGFGWNNNSAIGLVTTDGKVYAPRKAIGVDHVAQLSAGAYHTIALHTDGSITGFGDNAQQQLIVGFHEQ